MQGKSKTHVIGVLAIALVLVVAFWLFDLDDRLFPQNTAQNTLTNTYSDLSNLASNQPLQQSVLSEPLPQSTNLQTETISEPLIKNDVVSPRLQSANNAQSRLSVLESKQFSLDLRGTAFVGTTHISHDAAMFITMRPVPGTNLEVFTVIDAKFILSGSAISLKNTAVKIVDRDLTLTVVSDTVGEFFITAILDEAILSDKNNKQDVRLQDQMFYLVNKDVPYKLAMGGTLYS